MSPDTSLIYIYIFFWSSGIMDCMLFTFKNSVFHNHRLTASLNRGGCFPMQTVLPEDRLIAIFNNLQFFETESSVLFYAPVSCIVLPKAALL